MYVRSGSPKYVCERCRTKIPSADLEAIFREQLHHILVSPDEIAAHNRAAVEAMHEKERLIGKTEAELRRIAVEDQAVFDLYLAGSLSKEDFGRRHAPITARRSQLEDELPRLQAELDVLRITAVSREEILEEARDLTTRWADLPDTEKRQIVEAITDRITIGKDDIEISLLQLPAGTRDDMATRPQGFIAATSWKRAGYRT